MIRTIVNLVIGALSCFGMGWLGHIGYVQMHYKDVPTTTGEHYPTDISTFAEHAASAPIYDRYLVRVENSSKVMIVHEGVEMEFFSIQLSKSTAFVSKSSTLRLIGNKHIDLREGLHEAWLTVGG